jgi:hypothetical protein
MKYKISKFRQHQVAIVINILDRLPDWFAIPAAINQYAREGKMKIKCSEFSFALKFCLFMVYLPANHDEKLSCL